MVLTVRTLQMVLQKREEKNAYSFCFVDYPDKIMSSTASVVLQ